MDYRKLIADESDVSLTLTRHVASTEANTKNLVLSPLSLNVVLSLIAAGSSGSIRGQILTFLKSKSSDDLNNLFSEIASLVFADGSAYGGPKLSFANGVWVDQTLPLKPSFKHAVDHLHKAASNHVDFINHAGQVASEVNSWVEKQTNGLIKEILPHGSIDSATRLIFANAVYFKGAWNQKFDASETNENDFHLLNGSSIKVSFMTTTRKQFIRAFDHFKVLSLPYTQGEDKRQFSMHFFLPNEKSGLPSLIEKVSSQPGFLDEHLPYKKVAVGEFQLPRFKISFGFEASRVLKELGVELSFTKGGLTEITDSSLVAQNLYVSNIFQKSFIEVNEEGTEGAASSYTSIFVCRHRKVKTLDFVANHPFIFLIREGNTGVVLFIGHVMNPLES